MAQARTNFAPAMLTALLLHGAVVAAALFVWPTAQLPIKPGAVTTVTLVGAPSPDLRPAVQAPEPAPAATPVPIQGAPPAPASPSSAAAVPAPPPSKAAPSKAPPVPMPAPSAAKAPVAKAKPVAKPELDLDALGASLNKSIKAGGSRTSSAQRGPLRPEAAITARDGSGAGDAALADAKAAVVARLIRIWNPNCSVEGANRVVVPVRFTLSLDGSLVGAPEIVDQGRIEAGGPIWQAAAQGAVRAVSQAAPFAELPKQSYSQWRSFKVNFRGDVACRR